MDYSRLLWRLPRARRMLSCWVAHPRPRSAPRMTYGRSVGKALDTFGLDHKHNKWPASSPPTASLGGRCCAAESRRPTNRAPSPTPAALPIALTRPKRPMAVTNAAIQHSMQQLAVRRRSTRDAPHAARRDP
jgi:hypothetical protein